MKEYTLQIYPSGNLASIHLTTPLLPYRKKTLWVRGGVGERNHVTMNYTFQNLQSLAFKFWVSKQITGIYLWVGFMSFTKIIDKKEDIHMLFHGIKF